MYYISLETYYPSWPLPIPQTSSHIMTHWPSFYSLKGKLIPTIWLLYLPISVPFSITDLFSWRVPQPSFSLLEKTIQFVATSSIFSIKISFISLKKWSHSEFFKFKSYKLFIFEDRVLFYTTYCCISRTQKCGWSA